jgi:hypothetical protein
MYPAYLEAVKKKERKRGSKLDETNSVLAQKKAVHF